MPPINERMAAVETEVKAIKVTVVDISSDVKKLLGWMNEERGAKRQRAASFRIAGVLLTILTIAINVLFKVVG